jgi:hypothetical protein
MQSANPREGFEADMGQTSSPSSNGAVLIAGKDVAHEGALPINDLKEGGLPFVAVLIARAENLEWDAARCRKLGATRITALNARSSKLEADVTKALASALAGTDQKAPSARLLRAAKVSAARLDPALLGSAGPMVESLARLSGAPVEFTAGSVLATISGLIAGRFSVKVRPGWELHPVAWVALVGDASSGKSPAMDLIMRPLRHLESEEAKRFADAVACVRATEEPKHQKAAIAALPRPRRVMVTNSSIEALQCTAAEQGRGVVGFFDELSEWFSSLSRYSRSAQGDRGSWLASHNGYPLTVDRRSLEEPLRVPYWAVSLLGGIPPSVLTSLSKAAELESGDGLDVRLLYLRPALPPLAIRPEPGDERSEAEWSNVVTTIWRWRTEACGARAIEFDDAARDRFESWRFDLLATARRSGKEVGAWVGKLPGLVARLCGILATIDAAQSGNEAPATVSVDVLKRAAALADLFSAHRRKVELERGAPPVEQLAAELASFVIEHHVEQLNTFEIRRGIVPGIRSEAVLRQVLREFHGAGWLQGFCSFRNDEPLPATVSINPDVFSL